MDEARRGLEPWQATWVPGYDAPSFSWLVNQCILRAHPDAEVVIVCSDKARPGPQHVERLLSLLDDGYAFVGLHRFAFFGFRKDLIRQIGWFDERYVGGGYEDCDFLRRLKEANLAYYESEEVPLLALGSAWHQEKSLAHFNNKWRHEHLEVRGGWRPSANAPPTHEFSTCVRLLPEEQYDYDLGPDRGATYRPWRDSVLLPCSEYFRDIEMRGAP